MSQLKEAQVLAELINKMGFGMGVVTTPKEEEKKMAKKRVKKVSLAARTQEQLNDLQNQVSTLKDKAFGATLYGEGSLSERVKTLEVVIQGFEDYLGVSRRYIEAVPAKPAVFRLEKRGGRGFFGRG